MGRWGDGGMGSAGEIKKDISSPLPCRTTESFLLALLSGRNIIPRKHSAISSQHSASLYFLINEVSILLTYTITIR
ncbi:MAG: hypothetical protein F6K23_12025 [Okeania sp. SIO2C9]|uniref:hypothetical protein n=1 Tax=Okeania sp. SIO2C9 TaxID=2607791 RepID=UPI0013C25021|nr:hypothetical protein [Okeania sp. SIO2C9]NEQ73712.1 hypothetical protein [Okeania sp. SIO2C9]